MFNYWMFTLKVAHARLSFVKRLIHTVVGKMSFCAPPKEAFRCRDEKFESTFKMKVSKLHECRFRIPVAPLLFYFVFMRTEFEFSGTEKF